MSTLYAMFFCLTRVEHYLSKNTDFLSIDEVNLFCVPGIKSPDCRVLEDQFKHLADSAAQDKQYLLSVSSSGLHYGANIPNTAICSNKEDTSTSQTGRFQISPPNELTT